MAAAAPWIGMALSAAGTYGQMKQGQKALGYQSQAAQGFNPNNIMHLMNQTNPWLMGAVGSGHYRNNNPMGTSSSFTPAQYGGFQAGLKNIAQNPGYIDPQLMNLPYQQIDRGGQNSLIAAQGALGRSGMGGGLSDAYTLANQANMTQQRAQVGQQYALNREQQRRADLSWLMGLVNQQQGLAQQQAAGKGGFLNQMANTTMNQQVPNWASALSQWGGNTMSGFQQAAAQKRNNQQAQQQYMQGGGYINSINPSTYVGGGYSNFLPSSQTGQYWGRG